MCAARNVTKRHRIPSRPLQLAAGEHARRIAVNQNAQQRPRMIRSRTGPAIRPAHPAEAETVDHIDNEPRQVLLRQPFVDRGRKQIPRLPIDRPETAHAAQFVVDRELVKRFYSAYRRPSSTNSSRPTKSDRLLEMRSLPRPARCAGGIPASGIIVS